MNSFQTSITPCDFWEPALDEMYSKENPEVQVILNSVSTDNRPYAKVKLYGSIVRGLLDSGSNSTLISDRTYQKLKSPKLHALKNPLDIRSASGTKLKVLGRLYIPITFDNQMRITSTLVIENLIQDCILGMDFWRRFKISPSIDRCALIENDMNPIPEMSRSSLSQTEIEQLESVKQLFKVAIPDEILSTPLITMIP